MWVQNKAITTRRPFLRQKVCALVPFMEDGADVDKNKATIKLIFFKEKYYINICVCTNFSNFIL